MQITKCDCCGAECDPVTEIVIDVGGFTIEGSPVKYQHDIKFFIHEDEAPDICKACVLSSIQASLKKAYSPTGMGADEFFKSDLDILKF